MKNYLELSCSRKNKFIPACMKMQESKAKKIKTIFIAKQIATNKTLTSALQKNHSKK